MLFTTKNSNSDVKFNLTYIAKLIFFLLLQIFFDVGGWHLQFFLSVAEPDRFDTCDAGEKDETVRTVKFGKDPDPDRHRDGKSDPESVWHRQCRSTTLYIFFSSLDY
jgi:hypothetical protein